MIAVDTNILVYAHRLDAPQNEAAFRALTSLASETWAIPWPCLHEFVSTVSNPRVFPDARNADLALEQVRAWLESPTLVLLGESRDFWQVFDTTVRASGVVGGAIHDARVAAICLDHGVSELWTADRDFARFPALRTRNPLV